MYNDLRFESIGLFVSHFFSRGIIKNRLALGEPALQELMTDNLLKFNYFLTDIQGQNIKSYMKIPIPSIGDPARARLVNKNQTTKSVQLDFSVF